MRAARKHAAKTKKQFSLACSQISAAASIQNRGQSLNGTDKHLRARCSVDMSYGWTNKTKDPFEGFEKTYALIPQFEQ